MKKILDEEKSENLEEEKMTNPKEEINPKVKNKKDSGLEKINTSEEKNKDNKKSEFKKVEKKIKKKEEKMENGKNKKKLKITVIAISAIFIILLFISTIFALVNINNEKIISGVSIKGIDISGLSKEEASAKMKAIYDEKKEKEIGIKYQDYESTLNPTLMEVNYDIDNAVNEAYLLGRENNIFVNNYNILFTKICKKDINVNMTLNEEVTKQTINDIGVNLPGIVIESSYSIEEDELIITKGKAGICIDSDSLMNEVKHNLNDINASQDYIDIPVIEKTPEPIDIDKIHSEVYKEVKDAYYTKNPFTIYPEVEGIDFNVEEAKALIAAEDKDEYVIKLTITKPKVTINQIGTEAFPDKLATFTTRYDASDKDRTTNLILACQKINGKVILAGETFSYNKTLGPRTAATGYRNAKIYVAGEVVDGIGGGICQISSTLYNAVLMSDLEIVERRNHQFVTSYVPAGRDATVVYGMTDFKFKNTRQFPVRISASAQNGIATVSIYGIKEENEYTFSFSTKTVATIPFSTKYVEDESLASGVEKVKQKGANGLKTETYITKSLNGKVISTKLLSKDTYDAMTRIVLRGKGGDSSTTTTEVENTPTTNETPVVPTNPTSSEPITPETPTQPTTPETPDATTPTNSVGERETQSDS